jgi:hypothetical protein
LVLCMTVHFPGLILYMTVHFPGLVLYMTVHFSGPRYLINCGRVKLVL